MRLKELERILTGSECPVCKSEVKSEISYCPSGRRLLSIGCVNTSCVNSILKSPHHDTVTAALKSWDARKQDGHYRRSKKPSGHTQPDSNTCNIFQEEEVMT